MDKDDPFRHGANQGGSHGGENDFEDDARYDDAVTPSVREEEYAAGQEEWDQPIDELAEDDQHMEAQPQQQRDPFAEEGPLEDEYAEHTEHDEHAEHEHDEGVEHEHEHDPEVDGPEMQEQPRAASAKMGMNAPANIMKYVPYAGGAVALLIAAFFGYQQFFGETSTPTHPSLENQNTWDMQPANTQPAPTQNANEFQQPAPTSSGSNVITPVATPQQQAPLPVAAAPNPLEGRVAELTAQLEQMKQTQDDLTQKLQTAQQAAQQAAQQPAPSADENSKAATAALNSRIAELEQKLAAASTGAQMTSSSATSSSVDAPVSKAAARKAAREAARAARQAAADAAPAESTQKSKHAASTDFVAAKKSKAAAKRRRAEAQREANADAGGFEPISRSSFQGWILRSAQPGSAWLSQGPYSSDLRRVVPGDKVQGLGTVTSIHQIAGRWVVEGTQGAVR